jgi:adenylate kinase
MTLEAILLLGPTGAGKSPLGDWLERVSLWGRRCHHFDFGANLRAVVAGSGTGDFTPEETDFLRRVLETGALLEDQHFSLAARMLDAFIARRGLAASDLIVLNGLPRHLQQARALDGRLAVIGVVQLDCDARTVRERLQRNSGGDRTHREDDSEALVARKLALYEARTRPLVNHYRDRGVNVRRVHVGVGTTSAEMAAQLERPLLRA